MSGVLWQASLNRFQFSVHGLTNTAINLLGPLLVLLALSLIGLCGNVYFTVVLPYLYPSRSGIAYRLQQAIGVYLLILTGFNYIMTIKCRSSNVIHGQTDYLHIDNRAGGGGESSPSGIGRTEEVVGKCKKCHVPKPARAHHCSVCNRCVLKMDHHCPWIAGCVGHYNHRYFVLFLVYLTACCLYFAIIATPVFYQGWILGNEKMWTQIESSSLHSPNSSMQFLYTKGIFLLAYLLAFAMFFALCFFTGWHLYLVVTGQTTIEYYEHQDMGMRFSEYDLGTWRNLKLFLHIGVGKKYSWYHALLPVPVPPVGDGVHWYTIRNLSSPTSSRSNSNETILFESNDFIEGRELLLDRVA